MERLGWAVGNRLIHIAQTTDPYTMNPYQLGVKYKLYHYACLTEGSETAICNAHTSPLSSEQPTNQCSRLFHGPLCQPHGDCDRQLRFSPAVDLRLLAVSPEFYREGTAALYSANIFSFCEIGALKRWFREVSSANLDAIHHLRLQMRLEGHVHDGTSTFALAEAIKRLCIEMPNLRSLELALSLRGYLTCWRKSQASEFTDMFRPLRRLEDLRNLTVVLNEDTRGMMPNWDDGDWCVQRLCDRDTHESPDGENAVRRGELGEVWAEEIREVVLRKADEPTDED